MMQFTRAKSPVERIGKNFGVMESHLASLKALKAA
jgi:hypothetical protein